MTYCNKITQLSKKKKKNEVREKKEKRDLLFLKNILRIKSKAVVTKAKVKLVKQFDKNLSGEVSHPRIVNIFEKKK
jgi:hypothetical protein